MTQVKKATRRKSRTQDPIQQLYDEARKLPPMKPSAMAAALAALPADVMDALDEGNAILVHLRGTDVVLAQGEAGNGVLFPTGDALAALLNPNAVQVQATQTLTWTGVWPTTPGFYWFYGRRHWDQTTSPPALYPCRSEIFVEVSRGESGQTATERLFVMCEGKALQPLWPFQGVFAQMQTPAAPAREFTAVPTQPPPEPTTDMIHAIHGGNALCGINVALLAGKTTVRPAQLGLITCPNCRAAAERVG